MQVGAITVWQQPQDIVPEAGKQEFVIFACYQAGASRPPPPTVDLDVIGEHRVGDDFDIGHQAAKFQKRPRHVIVCRDDAQAFIAFLIHPNRRFLRIAAGVFRNMTQNHTA